jgi:hypothetical protein
VAYELSTGPLDIIQYIKSRKVLGQTVTFDNSTGTGDQSPLKDCMTNALDKLGIVIAYTAPHIGTKSIETEDYPGRMRKRINDIWSVGPNV